MTREEFSQRMGAGALFLDGATGSNLRAAGMPVGVCVEEWILSHPETLIALQREYVAAGSQIVCAPSFGANSINLQRYGLEARADELNHRLVALSKEAVGSRALVAGDMTTTGLRVNEPDGIEYAALIEVYTNQARALNDADVDLFIVETMLGVSECSAAIEAIRGLCDKPIFCTLSLDGIGAAYFDGDAAQAAQTLPLLGADAIGINCGCGPDLCESIVRRMAELTDVPIIAKPNAGMPEILPDGSAKYAMTPTRFAREMRKLQHAGARILGGCCGTTPAHIRALTELCGA